MRKFVTFAKTCKNFFLQINAKIYKKAFSNNELGHTLSTINIFSCFLGKYATFVQKFVKFAKIRDVCEKRAKTFFAN